jgi:hypothetical protein
MRFGFAFVALFALPGCFAGEFELGVAGGGHFVRGATVTAPAGTAKAGFKPGVAVGAVAGQRLYRTVTGEMRYSYLQGGMKLSSGGGSTDFKGDTHAIHYDFLIHPYRGEMKVQPFAAAGAGVKVFRGSGKETAFQPLSQFAYLTKTTEWKPLVSVGGGIRATLTPKTSLRVEFRDYITPFPKNVIAPGRGAAINGWLHDFVPMVGISFLL